MLIALVCFLAGSYGALRLVGPLAKNTPSGIRAALATFRPGAVYFSVACRTLGEVALVLGAWVTYQTDAWRYLIASVVVRKVLDIIGGVYFHRCVLRSIVNTKIGPS